MPDTIQASTRVVAGEEGFSVVESTVMVAHTNEKGDVIFQGVTRGYWLVTPDGQELAIPNGSDRHAAVGFMKEKIAEHLKAKAALPRP